MEQRHTPGPWYFRHIEWGDEVSDDWTVCEDLGDGTGRHIAHVANIYQGVRKRHVELANAKLIAASPDLLDVAIWHADALDLSNVDFYEKHGFNVAEVMPRTRAAIKKATE